jgi:hypothetical protein
MAASADRATMCRHPEGGMQRVRYPVKASAVIYKGAMVMILAGYLTPAADTAGGKVVGVAQESVTGTGADGGVYCLVDRGGSWKFVGSSVAAADVEKIAYIVDDVTVGDAANTNGVAAGTIEEIDADGGIWVNIPTDAPVLSTLLAAITAAGA